MFLKQTMLAIFAISSLTITSSLSAHDHNKTNEKNSSFKHEIMQWAMPFAIGGAVFYAASYVPKKDIAPIGLIEKIRFHVGPKLVAIPKFYNDNKDAIQVATFATLVARYGTRAFNSFTDGIRFWNIKQGNINAFVNVPTEKN